MRCHICGDSKKSRTKARGWLLEKDGNLNYYCHNCGASMGFGWFIKSLDPNLYTQYLADRKFQSMDNSAVIPNPIVQEPPKFNHNPLKAIKKISSLRFTHPAKQYVEDRLIPSHQHYRLYYATRFNAWTNSMIPKKLDDSNDEPRLVIPFFDKDGKLFGYTGRSFDPNANIRYITIILDKSKPKIFGLDKVDFTKPYFVTEGALDSLFLDNAVAMAGSATSGEGLEHIENATFVWDNEPRNKDIVKLMEKAVEAGRRVCFWPATPGKDINEMVLNRWTPKQVQETIEMNSSAGLTAKLSLTMWRKV